MLTIQVRYPDGGSNEYTVNIVPNKGDVLVDGKGRYIVTDVVHDLRHTFDVIFIYLVDYK